MTAHRREDAGRTRASVQAIWVSEPSLDFKIDRVKNRVFLNEREVPCFRDREREQVGPWRQRRSHCSARILTIHRILVR